MAKRKVARIFSWHDGWHCCEYSLWHAVIVRGPAYDTLAQARVAAWRDGYTRAVIGGVERRLWCPDIIAASFRNRARAQERAAAAL